MISVTRSSRRCTRRGGTGATESHEAAAALRLPIPLGGWGQV
jgi:hypothetical protein